MVSQFPTTISHLIAEYAALWLFSPWVTDALETRLKGYPVDKYMVRNPMAMDMVDPQKIDDEDMQFFAKNPANWAVDHLLRMSNVHATLMSSICANTNPRAFSIVQNAATNGTLVNKHNLYRSVAEEVSRNPLAIKLLCDRPDLVENSTVLRNPAAREFIEEKKIPIDLRHMYENPADWAVDIILASELSKDVYTDYLSINTNPRIVAYLVAHPELICWCWFSGNPTAIKHIRAHPNNISVWICANPAAVEPTICHKLLEIVNDLRF